MKKFKLLPLIICFQLVLQKTNGQMAKPYTGTVTKPIGTATSTLPKWSNPKTWNNNQVPLSTDDVLIPAGAVVVLDENIMVKNITVNGILVIEPSKNITISAHSLQVDGANAYFEWGTEALPYKMKGILTFTEPSSIDTMSMSTMQAKSFMVYNGGVVEIHGQPHVSWTQLVQTAAAGTKSLVFQQPVDWNVNDQIAIASTNTMTSTFDNLGIATPLEPYQYENEQAQIAAISSDRKTITLATGLTYTHWGAAPETFTNKLGKSWTLDERAEVGLLSRNIVIQGDSASETDRHGMNIMIMQGASAKVSGVELYRGGIGSVVGSYPFHWHLCRDVTGQYIRNSSIHHSFNRAITVHGSQNADIENNVIFDVVGHAIFLEDGIESGNTIDSNLVMTVKRPVSGQQILFSDIMPNIANRGAGPAGIWITHPTNVVTNNRISGAGSGIWYAMPYYPSGLSFTRTIQPRNLSISKLDNNTTHSCVVGLTFDFAVVIDTSTGVVDNTQMGGAPLTISQLQTVTNVVSYKNQRGIWFRGGNNVQFDGFVLADNTGNGSFVPTFNTTFKNGCSIGHSMNNTNISYMTYGLAYYDGPQNTVNCHFVNYDQKNQSIMNIFGGANKVIANTLQGITYQNCNLYNPLGTLECSPNNSFTHDLDGSFTSVPNSIICLNQPFFVDKTNFSPLVSKNGGGFEWGVQTSTLKFGQIRITRDQNGLNNGMLYYEWTSPTSASNGGLHDTGVPASPYGQSNMAVNTNRVYKIRYCDSIPAINTWQLSFSNAPKDQVYVILQGSPEQLVVKSGATTVTSIAAVQATTTNNAVFWDAIMNELHVKMVAAFGGSLSAYSSPMVFGTISGNTLPATTNGLYSRPYNGTPQQINTTVQAENFDIGGQNVAYFSNVRYTVHESISANQSIPISLLPSNLFLHSTDVRTGELVKLNNSFTTSTGAVATVIQKINPNEFWNYTFNISANGIYDLYVQLAAPGTSNKWQILVDGVVAKDTTFGSLGAANYFKSVVFHTLQLTKGTHIITLKALTGNMTLDNFTIQSRGTVITDLETNYVNTSNFIYPNPTTGILYVNDPKMESVECFDATGRSVAKSNTNTLDISAMAKGVYVVKVNIKDNSYSKRIIKE